MKQNIPFYINRFLLVHPDLFVPGLGLFSRNYSSATWGEGKASLIPPHFESTFNAIGLENDNLFVDFIVYLTGEDEVKCQEAIAQFTAEVHHQINQSGQWFKDHFGRFYLSGKEIHFDFDEDASQLNLWRFKEEKVDRLDALSTDHNSKNGPLKTSAVADESTSGQGNEMNALETTSALSDDVNPTTVNIQVNAGNAESVVKEPEKSILKVEQIEREPIQLASVKPSSAKQSIGDVNQVSQRVTSIAMEVPRIHATIYPTASTFKRSRDNEWQGKILGWLFGLVLLLLVVFTVLAIPFFYQSMQNLATADSTTLVENQESTVNSGVENTTDPSNQSDKSSIAAIIDSSSFQKEKLDETDSYLNDQNLTENSATEDVGDAEVDRTIESEKEEVLEESNIEVSDDKNHSNTVIENEFDCMIVVGAFASESNASKMEQTILQLGLEPFRTTRAGLLHVGVKKPCRTSDLRNALYLTREQITGDAWVLRISGVAPK